MQRGQQALFIVERQAPAPQGVVFVQQADFGDLAELAIEHLDAVRPAQGEDDRQVLVLQCMPVQL
ncbi:hypothetical protein D9M70_363740 [compost metagenome]